MVRLVQCLGIGSLTGATPAALQNAFSTLRGGPPQPAHASTDIWSRPAPQNPHGNYSQNYSQCLDQEIVLLAMPSWHEVLARLKKRCECDRKQYADNQITTPAAGKSDRPAKQHESKSALNISGRRRHRTEGNGAQRDRGYGQCEGQRDPPSHTRH
jgi:hypothetical protein